MMLHTKFHGGVTLIFSYICRLGSIFFGSKFLISIFFGVFRKINIFLGMKIVWIFFGGHHEIGLYLGSFLCIFGSFLKVNVQNGGYFMGC